MSENAETTWASVHLPWSDPAARLRLITESVARLDIDDRWWWSDLAVGVVELACESSSSNRLVGAPGTDGPVHPPCALRTELFPEGIVPRSYPDRHCTFSRRALGLLQRGRVDDDAVVIELAGCAAALVPDPNVRSDVLAEYAAWLERRGDGQALEPTSTPLTGEEIQTRLVARLLHTQVVRLRGPDADLTTEVAIVMAVARTTSST